MISFEPTQRQAHPMSLSSSTIFFNRTVTILKFCTMLAFPTTYLAKTMPSSTADNPS